MGKSRGGSQLHGSKLATNSAFLSHAPNYKGEQAANAGQFAPMILASMRLKSM
jgi:hypothetical protein